MKKTLRIGTNLSVVLFAITLPGCSGSQPVKFNLIRNVEILSGPPNRALGVPLAFDVNGWGTCERFEVDWGDGSTDDVVFAQTAGCRVNPYPAEPRPHFRCTFQHTYNGWAGGKTVTVTAKQGCDGRVNTRFVIRPPEFTLAVQMFGRRNPCDPVPTVPPVRSRTYVRINTTAVVVGSCAGVLYSNGACHADGLADLARAGDPFPLKGMRKFSLVWRVGTQLVQGSRAPIRFVPNQTAPLEFCFNESSPGTGQGGFQFDIRVDQLGPPAPLTASLTSVVGALSATCGSTPTTGCFIDVQIQSPIETRAAQVTVLPGPGPVLVDSVTLSRLKVTGTTYVSAKIYEADGTLTASGQRTVLVSGDQVTIPISATLVDGSTYRVAFSVSTLTGNTAATFLIPTGWQSLGNSPAYTEMTSNFRIESSWASPGGMFPTNGSLHLPEITISGQR